MSTLLIPTSALAFALALAPATVQSQVSASLSFHLGLFDGIGMGLAASHWDHGSIYSPGFSVGFGVEI